MVKGLSHQEAAKRLLQYGPNVLEDKRGKSFFGIFFHQFTNVLTVLLLSAAILSFVVGEIVDGGLIIGIVFLNALFGIYQEAKAEAAIAALKSMSITKVRVLRDNQEQEIDSRFLTPGDVFFIEAGTKIAADANLVDVHNLEINESTLTGESLPVEKSLTDEVYMGTIVAKGRGFAQVTLTGMKTKFGQIAGSLESIEETKTPLEKKLESVTQIIGIVGVFISIIVFGLSTLAGFNYFPSFLLAISLAVAVVPEGLPAVMTVTLAIGMKEMAKKKAIVRKLSAIEALGGVTLIATDKTGTLTTNKMEVTEIYSDGKKYTLEHAHAKTSRTFSLMLLNGMVCSTASLVFDGVKKQFEVLGDPTEGALLLLAEKSGQKFEQKRLEWKTSEETPFDSITKRMMVRVTDGKKTYTFFKGAPESIEAICSKIRLGKEVQDFSQQERKNVENQRIEWARQGYRLLAFSYAHEEEKEQIFLGMVAIHDPPRPEVSRALQIAKEAGIRVVMITGDNALTAHAIGTAIGLVQQGDQILTGPQLDEFTDADLLKLLPQIKIFARTSPFQKHRIVKLYQSLDEVVAVTGDGVNDALAIKQADVGIAMGLGGTDVARETADVVLTDDNFATIISAIEEGRNIIKNLKNAITYLLTCNSAEAVALILGLILGIPYIFFPIQLLYINLVTDGLPALSLAFSPRHSDVMRKPPERKLMLLSPWKLTYIIVIGICTALLVLGSLFIFRSLFDEKTGLAAAFSVLALIQSFILVDLWLNHRSFLKHMHLLTAPLFIVAFTVPFILQYFISTMPYMAAFFKVEAVSIAVFGGFILCAALILAAIQVLITLYRVKGKLI